jgi:signal transduction histidine kinase
MAEICPRGISMVRWVRTPVWILALTAPLSAVTNAADAPETLSVTVLSPFFLLSSMGAIAVLVGLWWYRERHISAQRRSMRSFHALSEEIIAASSPVEIAEKLSAVLPAITQATAARLYLFNRRTKSLEYVPTRASPEPMAVAIDAPQEGLPGSAVVCFRNRTLLNIPDVRRSPFVKTGWKPGLPRSAMFLPLFAQNNVLGVLEVGNANNLGYFSPEEQAAAQHLANQVAASLKLQEQHTLREQLFRGEKLAATGHLISGVASELRAPLESILQLSVSLGAYRGRAVPENDLRQLESESQRAAEIVSRLVSFAEPENSEARQVDVNALVGSLMKFREPEWKTLGLRVLNRLSPEPVMVHGAPGQVEQVFLNLLVHAEQCASEAAGKTLAVSSTRMAGHAVVDISYSWPPAGVDPETAADPFADSLNSEAGALSLGVCRGIVQSNGGELRFRAQSGTARFEVDLPIDTSSAESEHRNGPSNSSRSMGRTLTLMLIEPDAGSQRQTLGLLSARGHRVVPVPPEEAADTAQRLRFDAVLWALRPGGSKWSDFQERIRASVSSFVLLADGYDNQLAESLGESGGFLLSRPIQESELDRILAAVDTRAASSAADRSAHRD